MFANWPFHLTHRGNQKRQVFFTDAQRREYLGLLGHYSEKYGMGLWSYSLMPNHVHLVAVGSKVDSISRTMRDTQRTYSRRRNVELDVTGHLWANRYFSSALDETYLWVAIRYVELNAVRARIVRDALDYPWSSARANAGLCHDPILDPDRPFPGPISDWGAWLRQGLDEATAERLRRDTATGRPCGSSDFLDEMERRLGMQLRPARRGPKPRGPATRKS